MAEESAVGWARQYLAKGFPEAQTPVIAMFDGIERVLASGAVRTVHQVACCSGREIGWFAKRYPEIEFVGSDCDEELVEFLNAHWDAVENLRFEILRMDQPPRMMTCNLLFASGGLHYLDPDALACFFTWAVSRADRLYLSQPMDRDYDPETANGSSGRGLLSWNHPYRRMLLAAGYEAAGWKFGYLETLPQFKNYSAFAAASVEKVWPDDVLGVGH